MERVVYTDDTGTRYLPTGESGYALFEDFVDMFGDADTFDALYAHPKATQRWREIFAAWKEQGLIS